MALGVLFLKIVPMGIYGNDILFDASAHIIVASFILYFLYFFIDQTKQFRTPYFIISGVVLVIISQQRLLVNAHNDIGLLLGFLVAVISIVVSHWDQINRKIKF